MENPTANVHFCLHDANNEVGGGNKVAISGDSPSLGMWAAEEAVVLDRDAHDPRRYKTPKPIDLPMDTKVQYKYLVQRQDKTVAWEPLVGARTVTIADYDVTVFDAFGKQDMSYQSTERESTSVVGIPLSKGSFGGERHPPSFAPVSVQNHTAPGTSSSMPETTVHGNPDAQTAMSGSTLPASGRSVSWGASQQYDQPKNRTHAPLENIVPQRNEVGIEDGDGVIIVQYHLPVLLSKRMDGSWHVSWDDEHLLSRKRHTIPQQTDVRIQWVGVPNVNVPEAEQEAVINALAPFRCIPVFLDQEKSNEFYQGFCKDTLWPVFHNVVDVYGEYPTRWWNRTKQGGRWKAYTDVNRLFAEKVVEAYNDGDLVWIHDYHLLILPSFLARRHLRGANIGLFVHSPFPSSEIFRTLSMRDDLLRGMICADHIGFHLYEYARHFVTCCRRILGLDYTPKPGGRIGLHYQGRDVIITVSHVGIEPDILAKRLLHDISSDQKEIFRNMVQNKRSKYDYLEKQPKIIVGMETLERLKGIPLKLLAFELFLDRHPQWVKKVCLIQVGLVDPARRSDCEATLQEVQQLIDRINRRFGQQESENLSIQIGGTESYHLDGPIIFFVKRQGTLPLDDRLGLWSISDMFLSTPIRDSLNLWALEFAFVTSNAGTIKDTVGRKSVGKVIVSEFSGCSRVLNGAMRVNPWQHEHVVSAIASALEMSEDEAVDRAQSNMSFINNCTTSAWAIRVLRDLKLASKQATARTYMGYGFGFNFRQTAFHRDFQRLDNEDVIRAYKRSKKRLFVFDYGGVLNLVEDSQKEGAGIRKKALEIGVPTESLLEESPVPREILSALRRLASDPQNTVLIVSGKEVSVLERVFPDCPELCLAAEQGFYFKFGSGCNFPTTSPARSGWYQIGEHFDYSWKNLAYTIMESYTARTNGTYISTKGSAMVWHFADADAEFGLMQAKELQDHLNSVLKNFPVEVIMGIMYVEVRPKGVNKGVIVQHFIDLLEGRSSSISFAQGSGNSSNHNKNYSETVSHHSNEGKPDEDGGASDASYFREDSYSISPVDLVFSIGDDKADEAMFSRLRERWEKLCRRRRNIQFRHSGFDRSKTVPRGTMNRSASGTTLSSRDRSNLYPQKTYNAGVIHSRARVNDLARRPRQGLLESSNAIHGGSSVSSSSQQSLTSLNKEYPEDYFQEDIYQFSVVVGKSPSAAQYFVEDPSDVAELLRALEKEVERSHRKQSSQQSSNLKNMQASQTMPDFRFLGNSAFESQPFDSQDIIDTSKLKSAEAPEETLNLIDMPSRDLSSTDLTTFIEEFGQGPIYF